MALEQFRLNGQVAIVTGAGKGVGAWIARVSNLIVTRRLQTTLRVGLPGRMS